VTTAARAGDAWRLDIAGGTRLCARFVVDATGRSAVFARRAGARVAYADRLVGFARFFQQPAGGDPRTLVEAFAEGWWYTAGLPDGLCVAACMTDVDLARRLRLGEPSHWSRLLESTTHVGERLRVASPHGPLIVRPAASGRLDPAAGEDWLAVGDAASVFDPLSSQGIFKALRSGTFASYAIADRLLRGDDSGLQRYRDYVREEFRSYLRARERYYGTERRWPASEFWNRRIRVRPSGSPGTPAPPR
jgi:flavin-dependent dehydrogenase